MQGKELNGVPHGKFIRHRVVTVPFMLVYLCIIYEVIDIVLLRAYL